MDTILYQQMRKLEDRHWWFVGRRRIVSTFLRQAKLPDHAKILDLGCGTGGNLSMLSQHGEVIGTELDKQAAKMAHDRNVAPIVRGKLPDVLPFEREAFQCVTMLDVLEHIEDDRPALQAVNKLLAPGGYLLITVPAFPFLWGAHDEAHHHYRRYRADTLRTILVESGFHITKLSYYNTWLFPPAVVVRLLRRYFPAGGAGAELALPPTPINALLAALFASERYMLPYLNLPFGISLIALVKKPS